MFFFSTQSLFSINIATVRAATMSSSESEEYETESEDELSVYPRLLRLTSETKRKTTFKS